MRVRVLCVAILLPLAQGAVHAQPASPLDGAGNAYDLQSPLPAPGRLLGWPAPPSNQEIADLLAAQREFAIAFVGAHSRYDEEQRAALETLRAEAADLLALVTVDLADPVAEAVCRDYYVQAVPTLVLVARQGIVSRVWETAVTAAEVLRGAEEARNGPPPSRAALPFRTGETGTRHEPAGGAAAVSPTVPSPSEGVTATAASSAGGDYGPERLVDGLLPGDPGFRPWVSSPARIPPITITVTLPGAQSLHGLELFASTGPAALFAKRWPAEVEVLLKRAGAAEPEPLTTLKVGPDGAPVRIDLSEVDVEAVVLRVLAIQGDGPVCEMAEVHVW